LKENGAQERKKAPRRPSKAFHPKGVVTAGEILGKRRLGRALAEWFVKGSSSIRGRPQREKLWGRKALKST